MCGGHERVGCGDDFTGDAQGLQRGNQGDGAIGEQADALDTQVVAKLSF